MYVYMYVCVCICVYMYICMLLCIYNYMFVCMYECLCVYVCVYISFPLSLPPSPLVDLIVLTGNVLCVRWLGQDALVSSGADGAIRIWQRRLSSNFSCTATLTGGHSASVHCLAFSSILSPFTPSFPSSSTPPSSSAPSSSSSLPSSSSTPPSCSPSYLLSVLASGSADGSVCIWSLADDSSWSLVQKITLDRRSYPVSLAMSYLPHSDRPVLAVGSTDLSIGIYVQEQVCIYIYGISKVGALCH